MSTISIGVERYKVWNSNNGIMAEFLALGWAFTHKCATANFYTRTSLRFVRVNAAGSAAAAAGHASVRICTCKIYRDQLVLQVYCLTLVCAQLLEQIQCEPGAGMLVGDRGARAHPRAAARGLPWEGELLDPSIKQTLIWYQVWHSETWVSLNTALS